MSELGTDLPSDGAVCPVCGGPDYGYIKCRACGSVLRSQRLPTAGYLQPASAQIATPLKKKAVKAGARPLPEVGSVEALVNAAGWTIGLSVLMPLLALPAWGFAFLIVLRGRRNMGLWLFFLSANVATAATVVWWLILRR